MHLFDFELNPCLTRHCILGHRIYNIKEKTKGYLTRTFGLLGVN